MVAKTSTDRSSSRLAKIRLSEPAVALSLPNTILLTAFGFLGPQLAAGIIYGMYLLATGHQASELSELSDTAGIVLTMSSGILTISLMWAFLKYKNIKFFEFFGLLKSRLSSIKWAFAVVIPYFIALITVTYGLGIIFKSFSPDQPQELPFQVGGTAPLMTVLVGISLVVIAPISEELIFRGVLFRGLKRHIKWWQAALITSVLFGLAHGQWNVGADTFMLSMIMCWMVNKTDSLWPAIALHMMKNSVAFVALLTIAK